MKKRNTMKKRVGDPVTQKQMSKIFAMCKDQETKPLVKHLTDGRAGKVCELTKADGIMVIKYLIAEEENRAE